MNMAVEVDMAHGGRWTSLRGRNGREWLWRRHAPGRQDVRPGDAFVDAGGLEECIPTIGGCPDHGDAWSRPWRPEGAGMAVDGNDFSLSRSITVGETVAVRYRLEARPGWSFVWAAHALLDLAEGARIEAPCGQTMWIDSEEHRWPYHGGCDLSVLGPDDGSTRMIIMTDLSEIAVSDRGDRLTMRLAVADVPFAVAIWRNLGGWPDTGPYRNIAVEPMLGWSPDLSLAREGESAVMPESGWLEWSLTVE